jgi:energy-converting hydrogenase Eha subunit G
MHIEAFHEMGMIRGAPKYIMIVFFALGALFVGFSFWALYLTDIPQEQFLEDPRFEEEYVQYYQWNILFGSGLIGIGWVFALLGRKMSRR